LEELSLVKKFRFGYKLSKISNNQPAESIPL
jgi:hypothetical protein